MAGSRILVVDDHPIVLHGIGELLGASGEFLVVGQATTAEQALEIAVREQPDLVLLDLRLGDALAPEVCRQLHAVAPSTRIVILTAFDDEYLLRACLAAGVAGILLKDAHGLDLLRSLRKVVQGHMVVDERLHVHGKSPGELKSQSRLMDGDLHEALTPREYEVLRHLARGMTSKEIADALGLTPNTVRSYTQSILSKLGVTNRVQAVTTAQRLRLI